MIIPDADLKFARDTLIQFSQNAALSRSIVGKPGAIPLMWTLFQGNAYDIAVLCWCILFGSHHIDHQPLHWKNMFEPDAFREGLYAATTLRQEQ